MSDNEWFAPKRYGYGSSTPIAWQGWAILVGYIAVLTIAGFTLLPRHRIMWGTIIAIATVTLTVLCAQHTRGGWRWRWGGD